MPLRPLIKQKTAKQAATPGGAKVVHGYWIKGQEALPGLMAAVIIEAERAAERHEHGQYGKNRKQRRKNLDYRLHVKGWLN